MLMLVKIDIMESIYWMPIACEEIVFPNRIYDEEVVVEI